MTNCSTRPIPLINSPRLDDLEEPVRVQLEDDYTAACREVGGLLVDAGRLREGWQYLRAAGDKAPLQQVLGRAVPNPDNIEELIELALHEGIDVERGFAWLLGHFGTCNAITTLEGIAPQLTPAEVISCATALVRHVDRELRSGLRTHITDQEGTAPAANDTVPQLIANRPWLFQSQASHVDASHLAATVRFARVITHPPLVRLALELCDYGRQLDPTLQYAGDLPFAELYPAHRFFFQASLGEATDEALAFFRQQAENSDPASDGTAAIETLMVLLDRCGAADEAMAVYERLVPEGIRLSPYAPRLVELAAKCGDWQRYEAILCQRDDPVGIALGVLKRSPVS
ncbi:hypothetical protein [Aeoliella mucimassa]|uniref:Uncharacterized protein n=1 Tax=Aeoliella mucimassa TaxID=2527972 RepID=A0A518AHY5_9BACT|nr:hypothetical protein [Aeoliella mucimassa]QDU54284.1 hypothetical protein Pan181_04650 [Aeoliella mucimassa]